MSLQQLHRPASPKDSPYPAARSAKSADAPALRDSPAESDEIRRFQRAEIMLHWAIAIPFLVCFLSALVLVVVYNPDRLRPGADLFSWIHRISGLCLMVFPMLVIARNRGHWRLHLYNIKQGWIWTLDDLRWLFLMGLSLINRKITLPDQGKFNAGEKLNFMMVMTSYPLLIVTGLMIWLPGVAFVPWLLHFLLAIVAAPLMAGHIFMATINRSTRVGLRGMITGYVDREWAKHHYTRWYREHFEKSKESTGGAPPPETADSADSAGLEEMPRATRRRRRSRRGT